MVKVKEEKIKDLKETRQVLIALIKRYTYLKDIGNYLRDDLILEAKLDELEKVKQGLQDQRVELKEKHLNANSQIMSLVKQLDDINKRIKEPKEQAAKVERLKQRIKNIRERISKLEEEN